MQKRLLLSTIIFLILILTIGCHHRKKDEHSEHNHAEAVHDGHEGESKESHEAHKHEESHGADEGIRSHSEEEEVEVAPEFMKMAGITLAKAENGKINRSIDLSGEVGFNEDNLVHITPRFPGIVKEANFRIGEYVKAGSIVATIESNESMTQYSLKAPISGTIIEKHAASGEHASEEKSIYMLADLSNVWVNLAVYLKDAGKVKVGQKVMIYSIGSDDTAAGIIQYVTPVMDPQTRKITARIVLPNSNNTWRPGSFVKAHIEIGKSEEMLLIDKDAVQILEGKNVVFIQHEPNTFKAMEVSVGESDYRNVQILSGLEAGAEYVKNGAFELKAKIITSSMGSHAGHGH